MPIVTKEMDSAFQTAGANPYPYNNFFFSIVHNLCWSVEQAVVSFLCSVFSFMSGKIELVLISDDKGGKK